jgi:hypothetical protein
VRSWKLILEGGTRELYYIRDAPALRITTVDTALIEIHGEHGFLSAFSVWSAERYDVRSDNAMIDR